MFPLFRRSIRTYVTKYTKSHEWINFDTKTMGISQHAIDALGEITFADFSSVESGQEVAIGEAVADVESVKTTSSIYSPVAGVLDTFNEEIQDQPSIVNEKGDKIWFWKYSEVNDNDELMSEQDYQAYLQSLEEEN